MNPVFQAPYLPPREDYRRSSSLVKRWVPTVQSSSTDFRPGRASPPSVRPRGGKVPAGLAFRGRPEVCPAEPVLSCGPPGGLPPRGSPRIPSLWVLCSWQGRSLLQPHVYSSLFQARGLIRSCCGPAWGARSGVLGERRWVRKEPYHWVEWDNRERQGFREGREVGGGGFATEL